MFSRLAHIFSPCLNLARLLPALLAPSWLWTPFAFRKGGFLAGLSAIALAFGLSFWLLRLMCEHVEKEECLNATDVGMSDRPFLLYALGYLLLGACAPNAWCALGLHACFAFFCLHSNACLYNPAFLFMGYHVYRAKTQAGTWLSILESGWAIRGTQADFPALRRVSFKIFISDERKKP